MLSKHFCSKRFLYKKFTPGGTGYWDFGNGTTRCPTIFPGGGSLGASFNRTNWEAVGAAISDEIRAYANLNQSMQQSQGQDIFSTKGLNDGRGVGVTEWGPSLNLYRDPRCGTRVIIGTQPPTTKGAILDPESWYQKSGS